jgi:regulator of cell morphogenesis and NO signaling
MTITSDMRLADIVTAFPTLAGELEARNLDYCCGGAQRLGDACTAVGLDPEVVASELAASAAGHHDEQPDWAAMDAPALVDHLERTHHRYLHRELPRLAALAAKVRSVHESRHPELAVVQADVERLREDLEPHLRKEEQILFPMIRERAACGGRRHQHDFGDPIAVMEREHETTGSILADLHDATDGFKIPPDACRSYEALYVALAALVSDTHLHVHKENNVLFPMVLRRGPDAE